MTQPDLSLSEGLFRALRGNDRSSLRPLVGQLEERLRAVAKQRLSESHVEDIVQETLATVWEKRSALQGADHVLPFIFQTLRNKIGNAYLRAQRRPELSTDSVEGKDVQLHPSANPHSLTEGREFERILDRAIAACGAEHEMWGSVLRMLKQGRSAAEIRESFGDTPTATVHTRIFRARKRLKQILRDDYDIDL